MPGGRLTLQDRRRIAAGIAGGRSLAEIARQLSRPTSTIAREVSRNLGPGGYQADRAQQSTSRRARRHNAPAPAAAAEPAPDASAHGRDPAAVREFEERYTQAMVAMGLPMTTARVITCLSTVDSGSLTSADLVQRLRLSPATISKTIAFLEEQKLVTRVREGRRERYVVDDDVWYRASLASADSNDLFAHAALDGAAVLGTDTPAGARLEVMGRFLLHLGEDIRTRTEYWYAAVRDNKLNDIPVRPAHTSTAPPVAAARNADRD